MDRLHGAPSYRRGLSRPARIILLVFLALIIFLSGALAQVVIRERIGIKPTLPLPGNRILQAEDSTAVLFIPVGGRIFLTSTSHPNCSYVQYRFGDPINFTKCGLYEQYVPGNWKAGTPIRTTVILYPAYPYRQEYPAVSVESRSANSYVIHFQDPYYDLGVTIIPGSDLDHFRVSCTPDTIPYADTSAVVVTAVDAGNQEVQLAGSSLLTFSIDSTQFGRFVNPSGVAVVSPLSGMAYSDARGGRVKFVSRESLSCSSNTSRLRVVLTNDPSRTGVGTLTIKDPTLAVSYYSVRTLPDTLAYGDTASITVTALNSDFEEVLLMPSALLTFMLDSARYGSFITPAGSAATSPLTGVRYGDARAGKVKFVANGARDAAPLKAITVRVADASVSGTDTVCLGHASVSFAGPDSRDAYPYYPGHNTTDVTCDTVGIDVQVTFLGRPRPGATILLSPLLADSGGHSHGGERPRLRFSIEQPGGSGTWITHDSLLTQVNSNGMLHLRLLASSVGGREDVVARLQSDETSRDSLAFWTRVPDLVLLPDGAHYVKAGGTDQHRGPRTDDLDSDLPPPDETHFGTPEAVRMIQAIADSFALHANGLRMTVGDMSLRYGGLFDVGGDWQPDHLMHRLGTNVDLPCQLVGQSGQIVSPGNLKRRLQRVIVNLTDTAPLEEPVRLQLHVFLEQ